MAAGDSLLAGFNAAQLASARREANRISAERLKVYQDADRRNQELHDIAISTDRAQKNMDRLQQDGYMLGRDATGRVIVEGGLDFNDEKTRLDAGRFANNAADTDFDLGTYIKNPDGTFTPMIRPKGSADDVPFMPMTVGRSSDPNDTVIKLSTEDLQRQFDTALKKDGALGGLDNSSTFYAQGMKLEEGVDAVIQDAVLANTPPQARAALADAIGDLEGEELRRVAIEDYGIDVELLENQLKPSSIDGELAGVANEYNQARIDLQASIDKYGEAPPEAIKSAWAASRSDHPAAKLQYELKKRIEGETVLRPFEGGMGAPEDLEIQQTDQRIQVLQKDISNTVPGSDEEAAINTEIEDLQSKRDQLSELVQARQEGRAADISLFSLGSKVELTDDDIRTAIQQKQQPSEAQISEISQYMQQQGVSSPQDLSKLPPLEARKAAWLIGSAHQGPINEKLDITQKMLNYSQTGDMDKSSADMAQYGLNVANYRLQTSQFFNSLNKEVRDTVGESLIKLTDHYAATIANNGLVPEDFDGLSDAELIGEFKRFQDWSLGKGGASPAMQAAAKEKLPELFSLAIVKQGTLYPSESPFSQWLNDNTPVLGMQGVASRLVRNQDKTRIGVKRDSQGRRAIFMGQTDVNYLKDMLGPEVVQSIVDQLPVGIP